MTLVQNGPLLYYVFLFWLQLIKSRISPESIVTED
jgi:hypothetical protein